MHKKIMASGYLKFYVIVNIYISNQINQIMVVKSKKQEKTEKKSEAKINAIFTGESIYSNKKEAFTLLSQSRFGEQREGKVIYSLAEALFLVEKGKMQVIEKKKKISFDKLMEKAKEQVVLKFGENKLMEVEFHMITEYGFMDFIPEQTKGKI